MKYQKGSFVILPNRYALRTLSTGALSIYVHLCDFSDSNGLCWPSRSTLSNRIDMHPNSVDRYINELIEKGLISKSGRVRHDGSRSTNEYQLCLVPSPPIVRGITTHSEGPLTTHSEAELYPLLTNSIEGGRDENRANIPITLEPDTDAPPKTPRVIPMPYSVQKTKDAWKAGPLSLQVLEWFFSEKNLWKKFDTPTKLKAAMRRHTKAAERLANAKWSKADVINARKKAAFNADMEDEWTLETIEKYLTK